MERASASSPATSLPVAALRKAIRSVAEDVKVIGRFAARPVTVQPVTVKPVAVQPVAVQPAATQLVPARLVSVPRVAASRILVAGMMLLTTSLPSPGQAAKYSYRNPPVLGEWLSPQLGLFRCQSPAGARFMAETGFRATDCTPITLEDTWRVIRCTREEISHGSLLLAEAVSVTGRQIWVPFPWHDWA